MVETRFQPILRNALSTFLVPLKPGAWLELGPHSGNVPRWGWEGIYLGVVLCLCPGCHCAPRGNASIDGISLHALCSLLSGRLPRGMDMCAWWGVINPFILPLSSPDPPFEAVSLPDVRSNSMVLETLQGESLPTLLLQTCRGDEEVVLAPEVGQRLGHILQRLSKKGTEEPPCFQPPFFKVLDTWG